MTCKAATKVLTSHVEGALPAVECEGSPDVPCEGGEGVRGGGGRV